MPSKNTLYAAAGTVATASLAATVIAVGPALLTPTATAPGSSGAADLALARRPPVAQAAGQPRQSSQARPENPENPKNPKNPALVARQALSERYAAAVHAARHAAAGRRAAEQAARLAAARRTAMSGTPQQIAMAMLPGYGWSPSEFGCLKSLWEQESGWNPYAANPSSGAYGIPQALPGSKMATAGPDWQSNPATQITWGLGYIRSTYGSPCGAWAHESAAGWY